MSRLQQALPSLALALGTLAATGLAWLASQAGWWVMAGPVVLAVSMLGACALGRRWRVHPGAGPIVSLVVAGLFTLAALLVASRDTTRVASLMPILGGGALVVLVQPRKCTRERLGARGEL